MPKIFTYQKKDKLKSRKQTQNLFSNGKAIGVFPIKLIYTVEQVDTEGILQAGVGAPTRTFRKAVQRNRVKRLLREAYRLEKPTFLTQFSLEHKRINLFFLYGNAEIVTQAEIQDKVRSALALLAQKLNAN
jgi:ribonuclease P protein component